MENEKAKVDMLTGVYTLLIFFNNFACVSENIKKCKLILFYFLGHKYEHDRCYDG